MMKKIKSKNYSALYLVIKKSALLVLKFFIAQKRKNNRTRVINKLNQVDFLNRDILVGGDKYDCCFFIVLLLLLYIEGIFLVCSPGDTDDLQSLFKYFPCSCIFKH